MSGPVEGKEGRIFIAPFDGGDWELVGQLSDARFDSPVFGIPKAPPARPMTIEIQGKRIWWKPWRRRPSVTHHFPNVAIEAQPDGSFSVKAMPNPDGAS